MSTPNQIFVRPDGNVGIGTPEPRQKLEVSGNIKLGIRSKLFYQGDFPASHLGSLAFHTMDSGKTAIIIPCDKDGNYIESTVRLGGIDSFDAHQVSLAVSGNVSISNKLSVTDNVGIGTKDPWAKLSVVSPVGAAALGLRDANGNYSLTIVSDVTASHGAALILGGPFSELAFGTHGSEKMRIDLNGNVGIGTNEPRAPLHVVAKHSVNHKIDDQYAFFGYQWNPDGDNDCRTGLVAEGQPQYFDNTSICAEGRVVGLEFNAFSDARIKKNLRVSESPDDLNLLRQFKVTDYQFKDFLTHGNRQSKGFIAGEVEQFFPQAVSRRSDFIPDIYAFAEETTLNGDVLTVCLTETHNLVAGDVVRLMTEAGDIKEVTVTVVDEKTFVVNGWKGIVERLFVHGKKVNDFLTLDYQQIFALGISGIQQLSKQMDELKAETDALQKRLTLLESKLETAPGVVVAKNGSNGNGTH